MKRTQYPAWTESEVKYLMEARKAGMLFAEIAEDMSRTQAACQFKYYQEHKKLHSASVNEIQQPPIKKNESPIRFLNQNHRWFPDEDKKLWEAYLAGMEIDDMVSQFKRNACALKARIKILTNKHREAELADTQKPKPKASLLSIVAIIIGVANAVYLYLTTTGQL